MSHLSKQKSIKRKRQRRKDRKKHIISLESSVGKDLSPVVKTINDLKITTAPLKKIQHMPILVGSNTYSSPADFSENNDMLKYWGKAMAITRDIHGNYIVYWKERFPLFDYFDYNLDDRHFRVMLICSSQTEAEKKLAALKSGNLQISDFGHHGNTFHRRFEKQYKHLLPFAYYEDSVKVIAMEKTIDQ